MKVLRLLLALALLGATQVKADPREMVAAAHPLAVESGLTVLREGGSAIDAAVAVQMTLGVVEPQASGIGGGGFLLYYDAKTQKITAYDGRETAPAGAKPTMFLGPDGKPLPFFDAVTSGLSVGTPGVVAMLELAHTDYGRLPWGDLFKPAIGVARSGFPVSPRLAHWLGTIKTFANDPQARAIYYDANGAPKKLGERVVNTALADTLQLISEWGNKSLLQGPLAEEMVRRVRGNVRPGTLSLEDLANYKPIKREPVCGPYRVWIVCGMPPPSAGGVAILEALGLLEPFELSREEPNSLRSLHLIAEASRLTFADRNRHLADPAFVPAPVDKLLSPAYLDERRKSISPDHAMSKDKPVEAGYIEHGTSHITIVDRYGNAVSFTTTIEFSFGSQMMVGGFILNNELTDFSLVAEQDGQPIANRAQPGKRPRSSMSPTIVLNRSRELVLAVGSAGGSRIIGDTLQALIGMLDWNLSAQQAIDLPRIINTNGRTEIESNAPPTLAEGLRKLGHEVQVRRHDGGLTAIRREGDGWQGGADPRRDGVARGD